MNRLRSRKFWIALLVVAAPLALLGAEKQDVCLMFCSDESGTTNVAGPEETPMKAQDSIRMSEDTSPKKSGLWSLDLVQKAEAFACSLAPAEQVERREALRRDVLSHTLSRERTETEWVLEFPDDAKLLTTLVEYIQLEKACCSFLQFGLVVRPHGGGLQLSLGGEPEALDFIGQFMTTDANPKI
jgi:hypothetical protein